jgi:hypothetical protein
MNSQDNSDESEALEAGKIAYAELKRGKIDIETLYVLRKLCGWQQVIAKKLGEDTWQAINAMTSCCDFDFIPSREHLDRLSQDDIAEREKELITYLLECNVIKDLQDVATLYRGDLNSAN